MSPLFELCGRFFSRILQSFLICYKCLICIDYFDVFAFDWCVMRPSLHLFGAMMDTLVP
ncbi:hypothetical protein IMCC3088_1918 [Aequoribacter fuscus]|uniref:Uncharacterized protein n=1 Tax=Aequoribacter fuscus TaxID=2518989 RepID=F3L2Z4_9GAMM|nr:hypothetical protein IMCC3088_1918 [Aequoribacter fuscus]